MKRYLTLVFLLPIALYSQTCISNESEAFYSKAMSQINQKHVSWVKKTFGELKAGKRQPGDLTVVGSTYRQQAGLQEMDMEALISLVMIMQARDSEEDLKQMMEQLKALNEQKKKMREAVKKLKANKKDQKSLLRAEYDSLKKIGDESAGVNNVRLTTNPNTNITHAGTVSLAEVNILLDNLRDRLDSMNELSEMVSLRLQANMERRAKFLEMLSNLMKKFSDTQDKIISNLK